MLGHWPFQEPVDEHLDGILENVGVHPRCAGDSGRISFVYNRRHRMDLPDAPLAREGFFATHFFTVRDSRKIQGLLCPHSWRESDQTGKSVLHQAGQHVDHPEFRGWSDSR